MAPRPGLLKAWLVLTSVKYHGNLYILILLILNQQLALTRLRATGPRCIEVNTLCYLGLHKIIYYMVNS